MILIDDYIQFNGRCAVYELECDGSNLIIKFDGQNAIQVSEGGQISVNSEFVSGFFDKLEKAASYDRMQRNDGMKRILFIVCPYLMKNESFRLVMDKAIGYPNIVNSETRQTIWNLLENYEQIQQLEKMGNLLKMLGQNRLKLQLSDAKKRHQILGLPQTFIHQIESSCGSYSLKIVTAVQEAVADDDPVDGNDINSLGNWIQLYRDMCSTFEKSKVDNEDYGRQAINYIQHIIDVRNKTHMSFAKICGYISRQVLTNREQMSYFAPDLFEIPVGVAHEYADYIIKLNADDWTPADMWLEKRHLEHRLNVEFSEADEVNFRKRSEELSSLNYTIVYKDVQWRFAVPMSYRQLVDVGVKFHNCLPSCGPAYIGRTMNIVFVTKGNDENPSYALEIDNDGRIVQAVQDRDMPILDEDAAAAVLAYAKKIRSKIA